MDKIIAIIIKKKSQNQFTATVFDDFNNTSNYSLNNAIHEIQISNSIDFEIGDMLLIEIKKVENNQIVGFAKKYNKRNENETIIWK